MNATDSKKPRELIGFSTIKCVGDAPPSFIRVPATALVPLRCIPRTTMTSEPSRFSKLSPEFESGASALSSAEAVRPCIFLLTRAVLAVRGFGNLESTIVFTPSRLLTLPHGLSTALDLVHCQAISSAILKLSTWLYRRDLLQDPLDDGRLSFTKNVAVKAICDLAK